MFKWAGYIKVVLRTFVTPEARVGFGLFRGDQRRARFRVQFVPDPAGAHAGHEPQVDSGGA